MRRECSLTYTLSEKWFSPEYIDDAPAAVVDLVRQCGPPTFFFTFAPAEWTFPHHITVTDLMTLVNAVDAFAVGGLWHTCCMASMKLSKGSYLVRIARIHGSGPITWSKEFERVLFVQSCRKARPEKHRAVRLGIGMFLFGRRDNAIQMYHVGCEQILVMMTGETKFWVHETQCSEWWVCCGGRDKIFMVRPLLPNRWLRQYGLMLETIKYSRGIWCVKFAPKTCASCIGCTSTIMIII